MTKQLTIINRMIKKFREANLENVREILGDVLLASETLGPDAFHAWLTGQIASYDGALAKIRQDNPPH